MIELGGGRSYNLGNMQQRIRIAAPCSANWNEMIGDDRVRYCPECKLNVYNFSAMSPAEVERTVAQREGRLCARFYERPDGTMLTQNCPVGLRTALWRASRVASAVLAVLISAKSAAAQSGSKENSSSLVQIEEQRGLALKIIDPSGGAIANAEVTITSETSGETVTLKTNDRGEVNNEDLQAGPYELTIRSLGFKTLTRKHLTIPAKETVRLDLGPNLNMGVVVTVSSPVETIPGQPYYELVEPPSEPSAAPRRSAFGKFFARIRHIV